MFLVAGCSEQKPEATYLSLDYYDKGRLPLAPHVMNPKARPTMLMMEESSGMEMRFRILDKRTLKIHHLIIPVGQRKQAPWGGWVAPTAFVFDLMLREGKAIHGPEGHVNPVVWVFLQDDTATSLYEGWVFARDSAQTAWDHPRFDLTFLGLVEEKSESIQDKKSG